MKKKKKLVLASKILLGIFFLLLLAVLMSISYEADNISGVLLLLFLAVSALTVVTLLIEFVLEMIEKWKEMGIRSILLIPGQVVIYLAIFFICDYFIQHEVRSPLRYLVTSVIMVITITGVNYWKRVRNE
ncbi:hypothetical protein [Roseburia sp. 499]|uniref:hypothetical protein n=1 Tax=Roseburia sp. 499 TaxID=1261634 RepID=UPI00130153E7|nr:hypothetical protein [Roseburia sp. 499]WVK70278.1 hypothetical protein BIV20_01755 [Roseburia sp. 499]